MGQGKIFELDFIFFTVRLHTSHMLGEYVALFSFRRVMCGPK